MSNKKTRIAINGFGRIGRSSFKIAFEKDDAEVVAINDLANPRILAHLLKYDTVYGTYPYDITVIEDGKKVEVSDFRGEKDFFTKTGTENYLLIDNTHKVRVLSEKEPNKLPWKELNIDAVLECTGRFVENDSAGAHIEAGARKVVVSAPTKGGTAPTYLLGVNHDKYDGSNIISNASCTTNCISPIVSVIHSHFKIVKSALTTVHAVTAGQNIVDGAPNPQKPDLRRARAGAWNMVPTTTGAAKATTKTIPDLEGKFDGLAIRVPIATGSLSDLTFLTEKKTTIEEVNQALLDAISNPFYSDVLSVTYEPLVSSDVIGSPYSCIVDLNMTNVIDGDLVKILAWYDNEWGYSNRLVEMALLASQ